MAWTAAQEEVLEHRHGWLRVRAPAGAGKTAVLVERWRRSSASIRPDRVLVLSRSRDAADRFRRAALGDRWWAGVELPFTTVYGLAFDLVRRHRGDRRLLTRAEQWTVVRRVLAQDGPSRWPSCSEFVDRAAFVDEVAAGVMAVAESGDDDDSVLAVAAEWGQGDRWADLLAFRQRYRQAIAGMGAVDGAQLFQEALDVLGDDRVAASEGARWDEILVDDADDVIGPAGRLIERLASPRLVAAGVGRWGPTSPPWVATPWFELVAWPATVDLAIRYRSPVAAVRLRCGHPATEPDAIATVLLEAHDEGVPWSDMAVLMRSSRQRAQAIGRALARHDIPVRLTPAAAPEEPAVQALIDFFRWAAGDPLARDRLLVSAAVDVNPTELRRLRRAVARGEGAVMDHPEMARLVTLRDRLAPRLGTGDPGNLVHEAWVGLLGRLVPDPDDPDQGDGRDARGPCAGHGSGDAVATRALAAVASFLAGVSRRAAHDPGWRIADELALVEGPDFDADPWVPRGAGVDDELVTLSTIAGASGRTWDTVVLAGCLEGELPRMSRAAGFFDRAVTDQAARGGPPSGIPSLAERRQATLEDERRLFATATSRARRRFVATAAPAPGQLVSRFLAGASSEPVRLSRQSVALGTMGLSPASETVGRGPIHPDGRLSLSASRLTAYDDCPLRYFYQYTLGIRGPGGVAASMGTVVHETLAEFLDPDGPSDRSWEALEARAEARWTDAGWSSDIAPYQPLRDQARRDIFTMLESWWQAESAQAQAAGSWPDVVAVEYPFEIMVGDHRVRGVIDRIDRVPGGLAIVDYKTGSRVPKAEEVAENLQLATYHLAATRDPHLMAVGPPVSLQLCYLRSGARPAQAITADHAAVTEQRILDTAARILAEDFEPSVEAECEYCDFWRLCPLQLPGRQVGVE